MDFRNHDLIQNKQKQHARNSWKKFKPTSKTQMTSLNDNKKTGNFVRFE